MTLDGLPATSFFQSGCRKVTLVRIDIPGFEDTRAFDDVVELLGAALESLGADVDISTNACATDGINIIVGANVIARMETDARPRLLPNSIIWNLEQVSGDNPWMSEDYVKLLRQFPVWDYSSQNIANLEREFGIGHAVLLRLGYLPQMRRIPPAPQDIDVLFYGHLSPRRERILSALRETGLCVKVLTNCFGAERDAFVARAKIVLNLHFYDFAGVSEIVRLSYLLSNAKAVVSEVSEETSIEPDVSACLMAVPYAGLVDACVTLVRGDDARRALEISGSAIFSRRDQLEFLRMALDDSGPVIENFLARHYESRTIAR